LPTYKSRTIEKALLKKGFQKERGRSRHKKFTLYIRGRRTSIYTFISHGINEYGDDLLNKMRNQLHLTKRQLIDLIECPLKHEGLIEILEEQDLM
jgi:predicted RNA binding protein YcfA (HicA-like mRNA interferase family)